MSNKNVKPQEEETMDTASVYTMFEKIGEKVDMLDKKLDVAQATPAPASASTPAITPEDRRRIDTLTAKLDESGERMETLTPQLNSVSEKLSRPLKHHHTLDYASNWALIALVVAMTGLIIMACVIRNQSRFRDNDLKYRYVKMLDGATPGDIERLETNFTYDRNADSIRTIRRRVTEYERFVRESAEKAERARLNAAEAQRLQNQAETVKGRKK
jgi:hypothetical protein